MNLDGGEGDESISGKYGATVTNPTTPTKSGYQFTRWNPELPTTFPAEDKTYTAQWAEAKTNAYYVNSSIGSDDYSGTSSSPFKTVQKAVTAINEKNDPSTEFTIYLDGEFTLSNQIEISKKIKITTSKTASIIRHNDFTYDNLIEVSSGGELTLANVTIDGNQVKNDYSGIYVEGTLNLNDKATIQNCTASEGGGVQVADGGTFNMNSGAKIQNCEAFFGGGVIIYGNGEFKMSGGSITNCKAQESYGGGVLVYYTEKTDTAGNVSYIPGKFNMSGGTISGCEAGYGGAVCLDHGTFTMNGGTIGGTEENARCTAEKGGGVYVANGEFNMSDTASIDDCNALSTSDSRYGGGVYLAGGSFNMTGGSISKCNVTGFNNYGGGVYVANGAFTMSGGTISECTAEKGGGVYQNAGTFNMSGGTIGVTEENAGCTAEKGGGVYLAGGTFTMSGGSIKNCKVTGFNDYGGGVYISSGEFTMSGGTISGCTAEQGGGVGVYNFIVKTGSGENTQTTYHNGKFTMSGGTISSCTAQSGGGVYVDGQDSEKARGTFTMTGGEISGNTASSASYPNGGGVLVKGIFEMSDGSITGNMLKRTGGSGACGGAGVAVSTINQNVTGSGGTFTMTGGTISGNKLDESSNDVVGSGVYVMKNATFTNDGGTISDEDIHRAQ